MHTTVFFVPVSWRALVTLAKPGKDASLIQNVRPVNLLGNIRFSKKKMLLAKLIVFFFSEGQSIIKPIRNYSVFVQN